MYCLAQNNIRNFIIFQFFKNYSQPSRYFAIPALYCGPYQQLFYCMLPKQNIASIVNNDNCFTSETTSYRMKVSFLENKLTVTLQDLIDFVVYSKVFADDKEINKRVTLQDIFYSLTEATDGKVKTDEVPNIYQFGSLIQKDGVPYYKVQIGGKITVYVSMYDRRKKQQVNFDSLLRLQKVREMNQLQIVKQKSLTQKRKLLSQILALKRQKAEIAVKLQQKSNKVNQLTVKLDQKTRQSAQKTQQLTMIQDRQQRIYNSMKQCKFLKPTEVDGYSQSIFNKLIPFNQVYTFKVKIVRAPNKYVGIGVVDYEKHKNINCFYNTNFVVAYYWWFENQGRKYPSGAVEGIGYREGEVIQVRVDLAHRTINYSVNGEIRATHTQEMLGDESKIFMPFVQTFYNNSEIQWIG